MKSVRKETEERFLKNRTPNTKHQHTKQKGKNVNVCVNVCVCQWMSVFDLFAVNIVERLIEEDIYSNK